MKKRPQAHGRTPSSLAGTNLMIDPRTGVYLWRRVDKLTGKRIIRSTQTTNLANALREAARFAEELEKREIGLPDLNSWRKELRPLAEDYLGALESELSPEHAPQKRFRLLRALDQLGLKTAADLQHVGRIHDRLLSFEKKGVTRDTIRRFYQGELKQFSRWLADHKRHIDHDPLVSWSPIKLPQSGAAPKRRSFLPIEVARALLATDRLDEIHGRKNRQRPFFLAALITAARPGTLAKHGVEDLDVRGSRILLGPSVGKKRRGIGALDPASLGEIKAAVGDRKEGKLFLTPKGTAIDLHGALDRWLESFGLGLVDALWPEEEPRDLEVAYLAAVLLLTGRSHANRKGGNPKKVKAETLAKRSELEKSMMRVAKKVEPEWRRRMERVDLYALKKTHRTWAALKGVPGPAVDRQLGHASATVSETTELARFLAGSETGRGFYVDLGSELFDAGASARAVRELLDQAFAAVAAGPSVLVAPKSATVAAENASEEARGIPCGIPAALPGLGRTPERRGNMEPA